MNIVSAVRIISYGAPFAREGSFSYHNTIGSSNVIMSSDRRMINDCNFWISNSRILPLKKIIVPCREIASIADGAMRTESYYTSQENKCGVI